VISAHENERSEEKDGESVSRRRGDELHTIEERVNTWRKRNSK